MSKNVSLYLQGLFVVMTGILIIVFQNESHDFLKNLISSCILISVAFGLNTSMRRVKRQVQFAYQEIHTLSFMIYAIALFLFCGSYESLSYFTAFLFIFYAFSEIIFCFWLFNLHGKVNIKVLIRSILLALVSGIGTVTVISYPALTPSVKLMGYGIIFIIIGLNLLLYKPIMKRENLPNGAVPKFLISVKCFHLTAH
jgi:hypothetical protein